MRDKVLVAHNKFGSVSYQEGIFSEVLQSIAYLAIEEDFQGGIGLHLGDDP